MAQRRIFPPKVARRVELTVSVHDADPIPKVPDAGEVTTHDGRRVQVMHNGVLIEEGCYYGDWMTEIIRLLRGHHEPQEEIVFHTLVSRLADAVDDAPMVMVELGSFWAYYSAWFQVALPGARTIMVEPDRRNLEVGRRNFQLNDLSGEFVHAAVGPKHGGQSWIACESDNRVRKIRTVTLEGLLRDHDATRVHLLLCDIQGAELDMLRRARDVLVARRVRFLVISTHHHIFSSDPLTHQRCLDLLRVYGAHVIAEHSVSESCSGDGMIAASFDRRDADLNVTVSHCRSRESVFGELEYDLARAGGWLGLARNLTRPMIVGWRGVTRREWGRR